MLYGPPINHQSSEAKSYHEWQRRGRCRGRAVLRQCSVLRTVTAALHQPSIDRAHVTDVDVFRAVSAYHGMQLNLGAATEWTMHTQSSMDLVSTVQVRHMADRIEVRLI